MRQHCMASTFSKDSERSLKHGEFNILFGHFNGISGKVHGPDFVSAFINEMIDRSQTFTAAAPAFNLA